MRIKYKILILAVTVLSVCSILQTGVLQHIFYEEIGNAALEKFKDLALTMSLAWKNMEEEDFKNFCSESLRISDSSESAKLFSITVYPENSPDSPYLCLVDWNHLNIKTDRHIEPYDVIKQLRNEYEKRRSLSFVKARIEGQESVIIELGLDIFEHFKNKSRIYIVTTVILIFGVLLGLIGSTYFSRHLAAPVELFAQKIGEVGKGNLDTTVSIDSNDEIGMLADSFNQMTAGLREREFYKNTLQRYVSKQVADKIIQNKNSLVLKGEKRFTTIMFADIRGFTPLSERNSAHEIVKILNEYFEIMVEVIFKYNGTLDKFIGDAIMAYWGAPFSQADDALLAVAAALEMRDKLQEFNIKRKAMGKDPVYMGIGLNSGDVIAGSIGTVKRMEYTVIGDDVNLAQRIESQSKQLEVLISKKTYELVARSVEIEEMPPVTVKGKSEPVQIYKVLKLNPGVKPLN